MKIQMTPNERVNAWRKARKVEGWRIMSIYLPAEIHKAVMTYKNGLMTTWWHEKLNKPQL